MDLHRMFSFLSLASFSQLGCPEISSCLYVYWHHSFLSGVVFHCTDLCQGLFIHSRIGGHLGCFHLGAISNKVSMNVHVKRKMTICVCVWVCVCTSLCACMCIYTQSSCSKTPPSDAPYLQQVLAFPTSEWSPSCIGNGPEHYYIYLNIFRVQDKEWRSHHPISKLRKSNFDSLEVITFPLS